MTSMYTLQMGRFWPSVGVVVVVVVVELVVHNKLIFQSEVLKLL